MSASAVSKAGKPNLILVLTDDQGYGDLGCTGNPWIKTANLDKFHDESVRCTDFHVSPLCTPTRGALMTGHRPVRNGAWATCWGRSILRKTEVTMADVFAQAGYATGMFGKWHLGDNYPYRPQDRGFRHVVAHKGGGVGQTPDFWGNNYFDDTYFHNGRAVGHEGYCTDVWLDEALKFIEANKDRPFFCYLATNAPHAPYLVAEKYTQPYRGNEQIRQPAFYGMITNIDENFARLRRRLAELGLEENTILIFMTDNGSSGGWFENPPCGYNAGMRGKKASYYDGGHRVPFFIRWPAGGLLGGRNIGEMVLHVDLLPTFIDLCGLAAPKGIAFDGINVAPLLRGEVQELPDRIHFVQYRQSTDPPEKWTNAVITRRWRLVGGKELYDIKADPSQQHDVAAEHPDVVQRLRAAHEKWWDEISGLFEQHCPLSLGNDAENPTRLCAMDVMGDVAWHQGHILAATKSTGRWAVDVERKGRYRFSLRRWPEELDLPIDAAAEGESINTAYFKEMRSATISAGQALLKVFDEEHTVDVKAGQKEAAFELELKETGVTQLEAWFLDAERERRGPYYVYVQRL
ncbi:MAG: arylsulfatase [Planctomycetota bacterium]|jgi:arylsulfatase A-like enzyme